jgi:signal transduction histidine kinase
MEPFVQVDIGHTRKYDGVGVGLTLVNKIVRSHGGRVKIMSKLGQGTCVSVYLPFSKNSQSSPAQYVRSKEAIL